MILRQGYFDRRRLQVDFLERACSPICETKQRAAVYRLHSPSQFHPLHVWGFVWLTVDARLHEVYRSCIQQEPGRESDRAPLSGYL